MSLEEIINRLNYWYLFSTKRVAPVVLKNLLDFVRNYDKKQRQEFKPGTPKIIK